MIASLFTVFLHKTDLPSYYRSDSGLSIDRGPVANVSFTVVKPFTRFTMSQMLLVAPDSGENFLVRKIYDPRFLLQRFQGTAH
jgi:hypothetical protein